MPLSLNEKSKILIVEDDDQLAELLLEYLGQHGFELIRVSNGREGIQHILKVQPDLVILDLMLPEVNGLDVCRQVRNDFSGIILMLTASQSEADHVAGLELGADDFVVKPIEPRILLARIRSQLRRIKGGRSSKKDSSGTFTFGPLHIDTVTRDVCMDGKSVSLTTMEFDILHILAANAGYVVKREELYKNVLGLDYDGIDRGMDVHISRIRKKLQNEGFDTNKLKSIRAVGYLLAHR